MRESRSFGSVRGGAGNDPTYSAPLARERRVTAMSTMIPEVYEAFREANVWDAAARKAAEAIAAYDDRFVRVERQLAVLTWAVGLNAAVSVAILGTVLTFASRLGEMSGQLAAIAHAAAHAAGH